YIHMSLIHLFDDLFNPQNTWPTTCPFGESKTAVCHIPYVGKKSYPSVDMVSVENGVELTADLSGFNKEDVKISVDIEDLTLTGERKRETEHEKEIFKYSERFFGQYKRQLTLPFNADPSTVTPNYVNGTLTIFIPHPLPQNVSEITIN